MANYPDSGVIRWTGHTTVESTIQLSCEYTSGQFMVIAVVNGTLTLDVAGWITVTPRNYELKSGKLQVKQPFGSSGYGTSLPIDVTPTAAYKNKQLQVQVSITGASSDVVLMANVYLGKSS